MTGLLAGCGPLGVGLGLAELLSDDPAPDLVNPTVSFLRESGAAVGPFETTTDVTFRIVRNKSNISVRALVVGAGFVGSAGALDANGCPDPALFGPVITDAEFTLPGLTDLSEYTVHLRGEDPGGRVDCTAHTFFVDTQPPTSPVILRVEARRARELNVIWARPTDAGSGVAGYRIHYDLGGRSIPDDRPRVPGSTYVPATFLPSGAGGSPPVPFVSDPDALSHVLRGLYSCRMHYVQVSAVDRAGNESPLLPQREVGQRTRAGGDGTFEVPYFVGIGGTHAGIADVNGDGAPDVVIRDENSNVKTAFGTLETDGTPSRTFGVGETFLRTSGIAVGDLDGDRRPDVAEYEGGTYSGDFGARGLTDLTPGQEGTLGGRTTAITRIRLADLDGDSLLDRIRAAGDNFEGIVEYQGGLTGPSVAGPSNVRDFDFGDFDGDGLGDIAASFQGGVRIGLHSGEKIQVFVGGDPFGVAAADFNGDGVDDLATANRDGSVSVAFGLGGAAFGTARNVVVGTGAGRLLAFDFDEDGRPDLAVGESLPGAVVILRNSGDGTFFTGDTISFGDTICQMHVHDMNRDTIQDLVVVTPSNTGILPGRGARGVANGLFDVTQTDDPGFHAGLAADFDHDGVQDVAGVGFTNFGVGVFFDGVVSVAPGTGEGGQTTPSLGARRFTTAFTSNWVVSGDFDGDGNLDLVAQDSGLRFLRGLGNGAFESPRLYGDDAFTAFIRPGVADFDGDGALDLAGSRGVSIRIVFGDLENGQRNGKSRETVDLEGVSAAWVAVADLNDDRKADLVAVTEVTQANGELSVLISNGDGTFAEPVVVASGFSDELQSVHVVQLDSDGVPDLVASDFDGQLYVLYGEPDADGLAQAKFEAPVPINEGSSLRRQIYTACTGDFNGDGLPDLLLSQAGTGDPMTSDFMSLWLADGEGGFAESATFPTTGFSPLALDLNRDRILDIVTGTDRERRVLTGSGVVVGD